MNAPLEFIHPPSNSDTSSAIRGLLRLRSLLLGATLTFLAIWHCVYEPFSHWTPLSLAGAALLLWSIQTYRDTNKPSPAYHLFRELGIDYIWIFLLVVLAGRTANPFIYYYLVLAALSATLLSARGAWTFCGLGIAIYSGLLLSDIRGHFIHISDDYKLHLVGMWVNYVGSSMVISYFVTKLISALRAQHKTITHIREHNLKNEQLVGLATVSASTIHNLATPLSTLRVLIEHIEKHHDFDHNLQHDFALMKEQIFRCRETMDDLSFLAEQSDQQGAVKIETIVVRLREHYALHCPDNTPHFVVQDNLQAGIRCSPLFEYALINLINNAVESSIQPTTVQFVVEKDVLQIVIRNESQKSADELSRQWGKPSPSTKDAGLGIGSFLANSTIERQGGAVEINFKNQSTKTDSEITVTVTISLPLYDANEG